MRVLIISDKADFANISEYFEIVPNKKEAMKSFLTKEYDLIIIASEDYTKKADIMPLTQNNCQIPTIFLCKKPEELGFRDSFNSYYYPINFKQDLSSRLKVVTTLSNALKFFNQFKIQRSRTRRDSCIF